MEKVVQGKTPLDERVTRAMAIENIQGKEYAPKNVTKREAKTIFQNFKPVVKSFVTDFFASEDVRKKPRNVGKYGTNIRNVTLSVRFIGETVGKLRNFFNVRAMNIISDIREIFENSQYAYSSNYIITEARPDGSIHKEHYDIEAYHHFVNKVKVGTESYYVRFTVEEERKSKGKLHSAHVSDVEIVNKKSRQNARTDPGKHRADKAMPASDINLTEFFNSVKK